MKELLEMTAKGFCGFFGLLLGLASCIITFVVVWVVVLPYTPFPFTSPPEQALAIVPTSKPQSTSKPQPTERPLPTPREGEYQLPMSRVEMDQYFEQVQELVDDARRVCGKMDKDNSVTLSAQEILDWQKCLTPGLKMATDLPLPTGCHQCGDLRWAIYFTKADISECSQSAGKGKFGLDTSKCNEVMEGLQYIDALIFQYWR